MSKPESTRPSPFDLGDISAVKVGDLVAHIDLSGKVGNCVRVVSLVDDTRVQVRCRTTGKLQGAWLHKNGGGYPWAMHDQNVMRGYFSVNPEHIAEAERNAKAAQIAEDARKAAFNALFEQAWPIGRELGDGTRSGHNGGDDWESTEAAYVLAKRLTSEQMATLARWLGIAG